MPTRQQKLAEKAYTAIRRSMKEGVGDEYGRFSKTFPALLHSAGLCQALALAVEKSGIDGRSDIGRYLTDLAELLSQTREDLTRCSRQADVIEYQMLSRNAMAAATWLKRYAEALLREGD